MKTKTTLTLVIAGLLFLTTPLLAMAGDHQRHDDRRDVRTYADNHQYQKKYTPDFRHQRDTRPEYRHSELRDSRRELQRLLTLIERLEHRYDRKHYKSHYTADRRHERDLRDARHQLQLVQQRIWRLEHNHRGPERHHHEHYTSHDRTNGAVIIGLPNVAIGFNW
ncbi:MAG: hypothetical protein C0622_05425 [Desulfuromonas sp.]|nr:MAG: hypothetical protein C0622_05425 [Desulfuromonas sp.]